MGLKTWHIEQGIYAVALLAVHLSQHGLDFTSRTSLGSLLLVGMLLCSSGVMSILDRVEEKRAKLQVPLVTAECSTQLIYYRIAAQTLTLTFGMAMQSWLTLTGLGFELLYPWWRRWYRRRHPVTTL